MEFRSHPCVLRKELGSEAGQLAPAVPNIPTTWSVAEYRIKSIGGRVEIRNQQVAGSIPAGASRTNLN